MINLTIQEILVRELHKWKIELSENQYIQISKYYDLIVEWNKVMNLTAITDEVEFAYKHILDSILIVKAFDCSRIRRVIDIGTGAGLPGIPLKILFPELEITLLDSLNKRITFLNEVIRELNLKGIQTIHGRAEDFGQDKAYREQYDLCVSRAVSNLRTLSEYCMPYVRKNGFFIAYKSAQSDEEINESKMAIELLGGKLDQVMDIELIEEDTLRRFVLIHKIKNTKAIYPRKAGLPQKKPL